MNEETIKELLSVNYIRVIAEREGFIQKNLYEKTNS